MNLHSPYMSIFIKIRELAEYLTQHIHDLLVDDRLLFTKPIKFLHICVDVKNAKRVVC